MKKRMISLIVLLIVAMGLLAGCTADLGSRDGYQRGNGGSYAAPHSEDADIGSGFENGSHANADSGTRGNGSRGNGSGQRVGAGGGNCDSTDTVESMVESTPNPENSQVSTAVVAEGYGASGAIADNDLTLEKMLTYAIQDEYLAHAEYVTIIDAFGSVRPFSNIIKAEEQHIETLIPLFKEYGIDVPADTGSDHAATITNLTEAYQAGEAAETDNIAMYDTFLEQDLPDNVRTVFESLRRASKNHLAAFRNHF